MLRYLLDEQISPVVASQLSQKHPEIRIESVCVWKQGIWRSRPDPEILLAAKEAQLTLVTYDLRTIPDLILHWTFSGIDHAGVILVDELSIDPSNVGLLLQALASFWLQRHRQDWRNRVEYLPRPN